MSFAVNFEDIKFYLDFALLISEKLLQAGITFCEIFTGAFQTLQLQANSFLSKFLITGDSHQFPFSYHTIRATILSSCHNKLLYLRF